MKKTRNALSKQIEAKRERLLKIEKELRVLEVERVKISDKHQQYKEEIEEVIVSKRPKVVEKVLTGSVHWVEDFLDGDTGKVFPIPRNRRVMKNGRFFAYIPEFKITAQNQMK
jgi:hypothetical protein